MTGSVSKNDDGSVSRHLMIVNKRGLHARASAKFVQLVSAYDAAVEVEIVVGLEPGHLAGGLAHQPDLDRQVEQHRQVGLEPAGRRPIDRAQRIERNAEQREPVPVVADHGKRLLAPARGRRRLAGRAEINHGNPTRCG